MKNLAIYGAGGFGRETAWLIQEINQVQDSWNLIGFYDDGIAAGSLVDSMPVLGGIEELNRNTETLNLVIAIADPLVRKSLVHRIVNSHVHFPSLAHPLARLGSQDNVMGNGCIITSGVIMTTGIVLGDFCIINLLTTIGHDVKLGSYTSVMPQCSISGNVQIGEGTFLGSGCRILQGITLGDHCIAGAGAVITKSFESKSTLLGVPATKR